MFIIILTLLFALDAIGDAGRDMGKQSIHHFCEWLTRVLIFGAMAYAAYYYKFIDNFITPRDLRIELTWLAVYFLSLYTAFFDQTFNFLTGRPFWYFSNRWWGRMMKKGGTIFKLMALAAFISAIIQLKGM